MTPAEQNVKRQYPEAVLHEVHGMFCIVNGPVYLNDSYLSDYHDTPAEAWAEAEINLTKEKEK